MTTKNIKYGSNSLLIKKFEIKSMPDYVTVAMIAKRASGKSYLTREILFHMRDIPTAIAISKTEKLNKFYTEFIPELYIYDEYNSSILDKIYQRQEQIRKMSSFGSWRSKQSNNNNNREQQRARALRHTRRSSLSLQSRTTSSRRGQVVIRDYQPFGRMLL
jgi:hypothetical protein